MNTGLFVNTIIFPVSIVYDYKSKIDLDFKSGEKNQNGLEKVTDIMIFTTVLDFNTRYNIKHVSCIFYTVETRSIIDK